MTETPPPSDRRGKPADAVLAAELALGVLDAAASARAEAQAASDDAFAADAADWSRRLHPLLEEVAPVEPSAALWPRIELATARTTAPATRAAPAPAVTAPEPPATAEVVAFPQRRALAAWRAAAFAGFAAAAASLVIAAVVWTRPTVSASPLLAAKLAPPSAGPSLIQSELLFVATLDRGRGAVVITPINPGPVDPRARELWVIPKGGKPLAAGLLDVAHIRPVPLSPEVLRQAEAGATLAVSLEPAGGSPTGGPTGPVIAAGPLDRI